MCAVIELPIDRNRNYSHASWGKYQFYDDFFKQTLKNIDIFHKFMKLSYNNIPNFHL
jgi:hypothetical protein